jgi:small conductance mechanosensitive channel
MTGNVVTIRVLAKTAPEEQYGVSREIRERVKAAFDQAGVKAPAVTPFGPAAR